MQLVHLLPINWDATVQRAIINLIRGVYFYVFFLVVHSSWFVHEINNKSEKYSNQVADSALWSGFSVQWAQRYCFSSIEMDDRILWIHNECLIKILLTV